MKCGNEIVDGASFCGKCGTSVAECTSANEDDFVKMQAPINKKDPNNIEEKNASTESCSCKCCGIQIGSGREYCSVCETKVKNGMAGDMPQNPNCLWYYFQGNDRKGPVTELQVMDFARRGIITRSTMVWKEGFSNWQTAENSALRYVFNQVPPSIPIAMISDKWVWSLATVPLFANMLLSRLIPANLSLLITISVIALNIVFLSLDIKNLKESGMDVESWLWLGIILVPVYLFVRASKTNKHYAPGIVWCVLIVISLLF